MKVKSISEPTAVEGEDGVYNLMACVARTEGGIVIIDTNTSDYSAVIGADIAKSCKGDTIIVKNGEVVSTNMNLGDNGLKSAGITDEMNNNGINKKRRKANGASLNKRRSHFLFIFLVS